MGTNYKNVAKENESRSWWKFPLTLLMLLALTIPFPLLAPTVARGNMIDLSLTMAVLLSGAAIGWVVGILLSPFPDEDRKFEEYAKAAAAGISGYAFAKIDPVITELLKTSSALEMGHAFRMLGFLTYFIAAMVGVFGWRRYA